jgi:hypothetical protein
MSLYIIHNVIRLDDSNKEHSTYLGWVVVKAFMVLLLLVNLELIPASLYESSYIEDFILPFLLVVGRIRDLEVWMHMPIDVHPSKLRPAMLEALSIHSDAPHLNTQVLILLKIHELMD